MNVKLPILLVSLGLVLLWPASAMAKEVLAVQVCGDSGCVLKENRAMLERFMSQGLDASPRTVDPPETSSYYRLDIVVGDREQGIEESWTTYYLPTEQLFATNGEPGEVFWYPIEEQDSQAVYAEIVEGVKPFAAPSKWPQTIKASPGFDPDKVVAAQPQTSGESSAPVTSAQPQPSAPVSAPTDEGPWSNWYLVPIVVAALSAGGILFWRRRPLTA